MGIRARKERGVSVVYVALTLVIYLGLMGLVVDFGYLYWRRAEAQKAADAAALAGALKLPDETASLAAAQNYAALNGYNVNVSGVTVTGQVNPDGSHPNWYQVRVSRPERLFFGSVFRLYTTQIGARAVAEYLAQVPINISGGGTYGANGPVNLSVFGPYAYYSYGDAYMPRWLNDGSNNPLYDGRGYNFAITVPSNYFATNGTTQVMIEIFDPDCYNSSAGGGNVNNANGTTRVDEIRSAPPAPHPQPSTNYTTTVYSLYWTNNTPNDLNDDVLIATTSYGQTSSTDMQWVTPSGFTFDSASYGTGTYRLNVSTTNGASENGFNLRAGPPRGSGVAFNSNNGTTITATGRLPMNFNTSGTVTVTLGYVPDVAAGGTMYIDKFDTDVGAVSITYRCDTLPGQTWPGTLSSNGTWKRDTIAIPTNYTGGTWTATYRAGVQDTSVWMMSYTRIAEGTPGKVRLVQ